MNITAIQTKSTTFQSLEELIQAKKPNFSFEEDEIYKIQMFGKGKIVVKDEIPEELEGFEFYSPIEYKHEAGVNIYVKASKDHENNNIIVNIAKG